MNVFGAEFLASLARSELRRNLMRVRFDPGSGRLDPTVLPALSRIGEILRAHQEIRVVVGFIEAEVGSGGEEAGTRSTCASRVVAHLILAGASTSQVQARSIRDAGGDGRLLERPEREHPWLRMSIIADDTRPDASSRAT